MAPHIDIRLEGDGAFTDVDDRLTMTDADSLRVALLSAGMRSGKHSVALGFELPDGRWVAAQTSFEALWAAVNALAARVEMEGGEVARIR